VKKMNSHTVLNSNLKFECQRCSKKQIVTDLSIGEIFCASCGFVIHEKIENSGYESSYGNEQKDTRRTGAPITLSRNDFGLSTVISSENIDVHGKSIPFAFSPTVKRIRIQDARSRLAKRSDTSFNVAFDFLERLQDKLSVSNSVKETAAHIYRKAWERKITSGRPIYSVAAASMYIACRNTHTLRNLSDIATAANIKRTNIAQNYRAIVKQLDLKMPLVNQSDFILKISNTLKISAGTKNLAIEILKKATELDMIAGRDPVGMAAASIYFSNVVRHDGFSQMQIANASGITAITIRNRFHELERKIQIHKDKNGKNLVLPDTGSTSNSILEKSK
jgi:transcription initiation factor TFIIB